MLLYRAPKLTHAEAAVLEMIRELWHELHRSLAQHPRRWTGLLARNLRARAIRGSNSIEGYVVSQEAAIAALHDSRPEDTDETAWINVVHYREAMDYVLQLHYARDFAYSKELLKSLHFIMMRHRSNKHPGLWRPGAIYVRSEATGEIVYEGPPASKVPTLVATLCEKLAADAKATDKQLIAAAMAHLNLVLIHPFSDGNGRMARSIQTLVLSRGGILTPTFSSIEEYLGRNQQAYYNVLEFVGRGCWSPHGDTLPWIRFCLTAHYQQAQSVAQRLQSVAGISEEVEQALLRKGLPERAAISIANASLGYTIRNEDYRRDANVSIASATRDLKSLVEANLLDAKGERRGRVYMASETLKNLTDRYRNKRPIADPFELV